MRGAKSFALGSWRFLAGDDWQTATGIVGALAVTALIAAAGLTAWWVVPVAVLALLRASLLRKSRQLVRDGSRTR